MKKVIVAMGMVSLFVTAGWLMAAGSPWIGSLILFATIALVAGVDD